MSLPASEKLKELRESHGLTVREMARSLGMAASTYQHYEKGYKGDYLPMKFAPDFDSIADHLNLNPRLIDNLFGRGAESGDAVSLNEGEGVKNIPVHSFRAGMGGGGIILDETPDSYLPIDVTYLNQIGLERADLIAFEVEGDSMNPTLETGDRVMVNRLDQNPARGGVFAIFDSDTLVVKRIEKIPNTEPQMIRLISDNKHHSSYDVIADDTNIIGRVVWFGRRF